MNAADKKLNEMNRLRDMGHFPAAVNAGATLNVLLTLVATWWVEPRVPPTWGPVAWVAAVLSLNLLPVAILRLGLSRSTVYPILRDMDFWRDQHKFSDWVYVAASANMAFWILLGWAASALSRAVPVLAGLLLLAFLATFSPVLLRLREDRPA